MEWGIWTFQRITAAIVNKSAPIEFQNEYCPDGRDFMSSNPVEDFLTDGRWSCSRIAAVNFIGLLHNYSAFNKIFCAKLVRSQTDGGAVKVALQN
jgi:hypothetical protein